MVRRGQGEAGESHTPAALRDEDPDGEEGPEEARRPSSANVLDKMDRKNRLVYPLPLRTWSPSACPSPLCKVCETG
ncbi:unnamed protein product [Arctogadus glacialis]